MLVLLDKLIQKYILGVPRIDKNKVYNGCFYEYFGKYKTLLNALRKFFIYSQDVNNISDVIVIENYVNKSRINITITIDAYTIKDQINIYKHTKNSYLVNFGSSIVAATIANQIRGLEMLSLLNDIIGQPVIISQNSVYDKLAISSQLKFYANTISNFEMNQCLTEIYNTFDKNQVHYMHYSEPVPELVKAIYVVKKIMLSGNITTEVYDRILRFLLWYYRQLLSIEDTKYSIVILYLEKILIYNEISLPKKKE